MWYLRYQIKVGTFPSLRLYDREMVRHYVTNNISADKQRMSDNRLTQ